MWLWRFYCNSHQMSVLKTLLANCVCLKGVQQFQLKPLSVPKNNILKWAQNFYQSMIVSTFRTSKQKLTPKVGSFSLKFYFFCKSLFVWLLLVMFSISLIPMVGFEYVILVSEAISFTIKESYRFFLKAHSHGVQGFCANGSYK